MDRARAQEEDSDGYDLAVPLFVQCLVGYECLLLYTAPPEVGGADWEKSVVEWLLSAQVGYSFRPCIPALVCFIHF